MTDPTAIKCPRHQLALKLETLSGPRGDVLFWSCPYPQGCDFARACKWQQGGARAKSAQRRRRRDDQGRLTKAEILQFRRALEKAV